MSTNTLQLTNAERAAQIDAKAKNALLKQIHKRWVKIEDAAKAFESQTVFFFEEMRLLGEDVKLLTGHEHYGPEDHARHRESLPKSMPFSAIKKAIYVSNTVNKPITTFAECRPVQLALFNYCAGDEPRRIEQQIPHERNPWSDFVAGAASFTRLLGDLNPAPVEQWNREQQEAAFKTLEPVGKRYIELGKLLGAL